MSALVKSLVAAIEARQEERAARLAYDGYEWGYHGYRLIEAAEAAEMKFEAEMNAYIEQRLRIERGEV